MKGFVLLFRLLGKLLTNTCVHVAQLRHESSSLVVIGSIGDLRLQALALIDVLLVWLVSRAIGQPLNLISDLVVVGGDILGVFTLECALDSFLLHLEGLFIPTLLLHIVHEDLVSVDLLVELRGIATFISIDCLQVFSKLVPISCVRLSLGCGFLLDLIELLSSLELSLVLSTSSSCLEVILKLCILLGKVFSKLLFDLFLCVLIVFKNTLEVLIAARILELILELSKFVTLLNLKVLLELLFLDLSFGLVLG